MTGSTKHDILLGEYTLGLLNASETAQAHALLGGDQQAVAAALAWEHSLLELTDLLSPVDPSPLLLQRIQSSLGHDMAPTPASLYRKPDNHAQSGAAAATSAAQAEPASTSASVAATPSVAAAPSPDPVQAPAPAAAPEPAPAASAGRRQARTEPAISREYLEAIQKQAEPEEAPGAARTAAQPELQARRDASPKKEKRGSIWFWRLTTLAFAALSLALALIPSQPVPPPITILQVAPTQAAILQAPGQSSTPAWVVTVDPEHNILMNPRVRSDIPADASVQLWTHSKSMPAPRSLGLIDPNQPVTVPAALMGNISSDQIFEMTLEPKGGSPTASPSGPVLFIGRIVTFGAQPQAKTDTPEGV